MFFTPDVLSDGTLPDLTGPGTSALWNQEPSEAPAPATELMSDDKCLLDKIQFTIINEYDQFNSWGKHFTLQSVLTSCLDAS